MFTYAPILDSHASDVAYALSLAGPDYRWEHPAAPATIDSAHRQGLTALMYDAQQGLCAACGDTLAGERYDLCHIVPSRVSGRGTMAGNIYLGHSSCNSDDAKEFTDGVVPLESLIRRDLIVCTFPTRKECVARAVELRQARENRRFNRLATVAL